MSTVTQRIKEIKQPRGGYLKISDFDVIHLTDDKVLNDEENIHPSIVGMAVDYMTRFMMGASVEDAFQISILGASYAEQVIGETENEIQMYLSGIKGTDDESIINACKAVTFDVWFRNLFSAIGVKRAAETNPDLKTIENIRIMIERSVKFLKEYGPVLVDGFTFEGGGYTETVNSGDGDFLTEDTLWDFKVLKSDPTSSHTLQILMYYIMGKHSGKEEYNNISKIGIFNPRLNKVYIKDVNEIDEEIIDEVSNNIIGYSSETDEKFEYESKLLEMSEIMKILGCSRYKVMKYYSENDLPLIKEKNKYYIKEDELFEWIEEQQRLEKQEMIIKAIILGLLFFIMMFVLSSLF